MRTKTIIAIAIAAVVSFSLVGCGASGSVDSATAVDLTGEWEQSNSSANGSVQVATIAADTISISWLADGAKSLYWAGTVETPPDGSGEFSWESENDTSQTDKALLASSDPTKTFTYSNGLIKYEATALGVTWTVELKQTSTTPASAPTAAESEFDVTIDGATYTTDYEGKPVIIITFGFTNNSSAPASFGWTVDAQAFQGGIELDDFVFIDGFDSSLENSDVQPGITVSIQKPYILRDSSAVTAQVSDLTTDKVIVSQEFSAG